MHAVGNYYPVPAKYTYLFVTDEHTGADVLECNEDVTIKSLIIRDEYQTKFMVFASVQQYMHTYHITLTNGRLQKHLTHEVILWWQKQKLKFDIDGGTPSQHSTIVEIIESEFYDVYGIEPVIAIIPSVNTKPGETKHSSHVIITNCAVENHKEAQWFTAHIRDGMPSELSKLIDDVNKSTQNFRLACTTNKSGRILQLPSGINFEDTIITNTTNCIILDRKLLTVGKPKDIAVTSNMPADLKPHITCGDAFRFKKQVGALFIFRRIASSHCDICNRTHDSVGAFICVHEQNGEPAALTRHCYRNKESHITLWKKPLQALLTWHDVCDKYEGIKFESTKSTVWDELKEHLKNVVKTVNVGDTTVYLRISETSYKVQKFTTFIESARRIYCYYKDGTYQKLKFSDVVLASGREFRYHGALFRPMQYCPPTHINTFLGFNAKILPAVDLTYIQPILDHIMHVIAAGNVELYNYILDWIAHIVQHGTKTRTVLVLCGQHGVGKNIISDFLINKVIGTDYSADCRNIESITSKFNANFQHKLLTVINEANFEGDPTHFHRVFDMMKDLIVNPRNIIERKGIDSCNEDDFNNYIITSNNDTPIKLEDGDRRYTVIKCSSAKKGNTGYFNNLAKYTTGNLSDVAANNFITFLSTRAITANIHSPFETEFKQIMLNNTRKIDVFAEFVKDILYESDEIAEDMFISDFEYFCVKNQYRSPQRRQIIGKLIDIGYIIERKRHQKRDAGKKVNYYTVIIDKKYVELPEPNINVNLNL